MSTNSYLRIVRAPALSPVSFTPIPCPADISPRKVIVYNDTGADIQISTETSPVPLTIAASIQFVITLDPTNATGFPRGQTMFSLQGANPPLLILTA